MGQDVSRIRDLELTYVRRFAPRSSSPVLCNRTTLHSPACTGERSQPLHNGLGMDGSALYYQAGLKTESRTCGNMGRHKNPPTTRTVDKRTCNSDRLCEFLYILITLLVTLKTLALLHETWDQVRIRRHFGLGPFAQCLLLSLCTVSLKTTGPSSMLLPGGDQESAHRTVADASYYARSRRRVPNADAPAGYCDRICCSIQQG